MLFACLNSDSITGCCPNGPNIEGTDFFIELRIPDGLILLPPESFRMMVKLERYCCTLSSIFWKGCPIFFQLV